MRDLVCSRKEGPILHRQHEPKTKRKDRWRLEDSHDKTVVKDIWEHVVDAKDRWEHTDVKDRWGHTDVKDHWKHTNVEVQKARTTAALHGVQYRIVCRIGDHVAAG